MRMRKKGGGKKGGKGRKGDERKRVRRGKVEERSEEGVGRGYWETGEGGIWWGCGLKGLVEQYLSFPLRFSLQYLPHAFPSPSLFLLSPPSPVSHLISFHVSPSFVSRLPSFASLPQLT